MKLIDITDLRLRDASLASCFLIFSLVEDGVEISLLAGW